MRKEAEPGLSVANCVSQRKAGPARSQPLRSRAVGFEPFQGWIEWSLNGPIQKPPLTEGQNEGRNVVIGFPREPTVGKHSEGRVQQSLASTETVSAGGEVAKAAWDQRTLSPAGDLCLLLGRDLLPVGLSGGALWVTTSLSSFLSCCPSVDSECP